MSIQRWLVGTYSKIDLIVFCITVVFFSTGLYYIDLLIVPDSDVFEFIHYSNSFDNLSLPPEFKSGLITPLLMSLFRWLPVEFPKIWIASFVNIVSVSVSIPLLYAVVKRNTNNLWGLLSVIIFLSHPRVFTLAIDVETQPQLTVLFLLSLYLFTTKVKHSLYISALAPILRLDGLSVFFSWIAAWIISQKKKSAKKKLSNYISKLDFVLSTVLALSWISFSTVYNMMQGQIYGNDYVREIIEGGWISKASVFLLNFSHTILSPSHSQYLQDIPVFFGVMSILIVFLVLYSVFTAFHKCNKIVIMSGMFLLLYVGVQLLFPIFSDRYYYPLSATLIIIASFGLYSLNTISKLSRWLKVFAVIVILVFNIANFPSFTVYQQQYFSEKRALATWLNQQSFSEKVTVITTYPWIVKFYMNNSQVLLYDLSPEDLNNCSSISCVVSSNSLEGDIFVVQDNASIRFSTSNVAEYQYLNTKNIFHSPQDIPCLEKMHSYSQRDRWFTVQSFKSDCVENSN